MPTRGDNDSTPEEGQAKEKSSFLKKRTKKLSILQGRVARIGRIKRGTKVLWSFQKRNTSLLRWYVTLYAGWYYVFCLGPSLAGAIPG
jgi:hypothetical protein